MIEDVSDLSVRVSEIFMSIQGEGPSVGTPSVFVRLQGCTVGCAWCDTKYSWDARRGDALMLDSLLRRIKDAGVPNVVVTGGEPLEHPAFVPLVAGLSASATSTTSRRCWRSRPITGSLPSASC